MRRSPVHFDQTSRPGFALVVTLSLMILLTIVAVGLLSLASISLRSSDKMEAGARARANAKMALMLALGDLQKQMGPDSRISAPQDAGAIATGGKPHWTAVYDSWGRATGSSNAMETPNTRSPEFKGWLVSGANQATGGPAGTTDLALLVGPGSLGGLNSPNDEIRVPMHAVTSANRSGRVAWWVSDEGTKAKVNAGPDENSASRFAKADPLFHAQSPSNMGHQAIPALSELEWGEGKREITISNAQINLAAEIDRDALGNSIHDITVHSAGVLADVRAGRLKRDLNNLLSRPVTDLQNKPLYLADGRMNWLNVSSDGAISNSAGISSSWTPGYNSAAQWGINFEELHLFHSLHREINWTGGSPKLVMKNTREAVVQDRHYLYRRPSVQGLQFIFSLRAVPHTGAGIPAGRYKMEMNLDAMVALSNPNDIPIQYPPGLILPFQLLNLPYGLTWNIQRAAGGPLTETTSFSNFDVFKGHVEGGTGGVPASGFTLEAGEAAVFGSSTAKGYDLNLRRGFVPSGGVILSNWDLKAGGLQPSDMVDFDFKRIAKTTSANAWTYYNTWFGLRGGSKGWQMDSAALFGGSLSSALMSQYIPPSIKPPQVRPVSDFIGKPQPVLMLSFLQNVEQASSTSPPDAFASRPYLFNEPALTERSMNPDRVTLDRHATQLIVSAEPMNYQFRTLAAGAGGRNIYIGGGRQPNLGGTFNAVSRRIPVSPPLSIGAFQNAIASGFCDHFSEQTLRAQIGGNTLAVGGDPFPANAVALTGHVHALPLVSRTIGNSRGIPHLAPGEVFSQSGQSTAVRGTVGNVATDHSWMANTALWDSWFLSSIVDGTGLGSSAWLDDPRSPRAQFRDFAEGKRTLRNKRLIFNPYQTPDKAVSALFNGENFKTSAINQLPAYLLVDGCFNVNSTSEKAWAALLTSVRDQNLITANGGTKSFNQPFGTLGYAVSNASSGTEGDWTGLRDLSNSEIEKLATAIVTEVRSRGPFLSMADFVNRRPNSDDATHQALGALQAAIDYSGLNEHMAEGTRRASSADFAPLSGSASVDKEPAPARAVGTPGYLSQGDLLTAIGSQISVRSDTFVIRAYGDARDTSDKILASAWCEAVIQRVPEYVDPMDSPEAQDGWPGATSKLTPVNTRFGRRLIMQSFRWLASNEI